MLKHIKKEIGSIVLIIIFAAVLALTKLDFLDFYSDTEKLRTFISGFGMLGPLVMFLLVLIAHILIVIPNAPIFIIGGLLFDFKLALLISIAGIIIGSSITFLMARKLGRAYVQHHMSNRELHHFDIFFRKKLKPALFLSRLIPVLPSDFINLFMGITNIRFHDFFWISLFGFIPGTVMWVMMGQSMATGTIGFDVVLLNAVSLVLFFLYSLRHKIRIFLIREVRLFEKEAVIVEKKILEDIRIAEIDVAKAEAMLESEFEKIKEKILSKRVR